MAARKKAAPADADTERQKEGLKWHSELQLAHKREKPWRAEGTSILQRYRAESRRKSRFNVLWSNTQILRPAIYNSRPNPDVRRRFRDADPVGKAVSEVLERSLSIVIDGDETDDAIKNDVLDCLLPGRGVSRVRYVPRITKVQKDKSAVDLNEGNTAKDADDGTENAPPDEELDGEYVCIEHVDWQDYREGYGRVWAEVPWTAYRHKLTRKDALEKFDEKDLAGVEFAPDDEREDDHHKEDGTNQKVAEFWETWDKIGGKVFFLQENVKRIIYPKDTPDGEPPFEIDGFFPSPNPLNIMEDTSTRVPVPMFRMYESEADELDDICRRINRIIKQCRARAVYDSKLPELADLMSNEDGEMTPVQNAQAWSEGGLDKAISWMPIDMLVAVLKQLTEARMLQKSMIDEIIGITDIQRGATDPTETLGAQELKQNNASVRLQSMQREVQRYIRDLLRICTAVMAEKFSPQTFALMTEMQFPTAQQKQQLVAQLEAQAQQAMMPPPGPQTPGAPAAPQPGANPAAPGPAGPPPPPPQPPQPSPQQQAMLKLPTWEDIIAVMRSEKRRQYKIDVETDSTIAHTLSNDMVGLSQVLKSVTEALTEMAPLIQAGALPVDAAKEIVMAIIRRARMGLAVEDAFDKLQAPKPPPDKDAAKAQADVAKVQAQGQVDMSIAKMDAQLKAWVAQQEQQLQAQQNTQEQMLEAQRSASDSQMKQMEIRLDAMTKIVVAAVTAKIDQQTTIETADREVESDGG